MSDPSLRDRTRDAELFEYNPKDCKAPSEVTTVDAEWTMRTTERSPRVCRGTAQMGASELGLVVNDALEISTFEEKAHNEVCGDSLDEGLHDLADHLRAADLLEVAHGRAS